MKTLYVFFFISLCVFFSILVFKHFEISLPNWINFYVNDFLCMPVVLTISLKTVHLFTGDHSIRLPVLLILVLTSIYAIYFEYYMPLVEPRYTADWLDVIMYFTGAAIFYFLQYSGKQKSKTPQGAFV